MSREGDHVEPVIILFSPTYMFAGCSFYLNPEARRRKFRIKLLHN